MAVNLPGFLIATRTRCTNGTRTGLSLYSFAAGEVNCVSSALREEPVAL